tara:strand:- start:5505 stop:5846 length:342 start_codon:yes stop_codon:yes gene_type:complete
MTWTTPRRWRKRKKKGSSRACPPRRAIGGTGMTGTAAVGTGIGTEGMTEGITATEAVTGTAAAIARDPGTGTTIGIGTDGTVANGTRPTVDGDILRHPDVTASTLNNICPNKI